MSKMKNLVLGVGIFVVYLLVLGQGIETFHPSPQYEDFCPTAVPLQGALEPGERIGSVDSECREGFQEARDVYSQSVFIISLIAGIITLIIGYSVLSTEPVGSALIASGIGAIFYGSISNWRNFTDVWRFLLLLLALVFIIWLALRLNKKQKKFWKFWK